MILVTGGMGFIGMHAVRQFLDAGEDVVIGVHSSRREPDIFKDEIGGRVSATCLPPFPKTPEFAKSRRRAIELNQRSGSQDADENNAIMIDYQETNVS